MAERGLFSDWATLELALNVVNEVQKLLEATGHNIWDIGPIRVEHVAGEPRYQCRLVVEFKGERDCHE